MKALTFENCRPCCFIASTCAGHAARPQIAKSAARYRLSEIYGDGAMDPARSAITLEELIEEDPDHRDAHYRLAQELYLLGRYSEAHRACERLIQLAEH